jgi:hypothetical protein
MQRGLMCEKNCVVFAAKAQRKKETIVRLSLTSR